MSAPDTAARHLERIAADLATVTTLIGPARQAIRAALPGPRSTPTDNGGHAGRDEWAQLDAALALHRDDAIAADRAIATILARALVNVETLAWARRCPATATQPTTALERLSAGVGALRHPEAILGRSRAEWGETNRTLRTVERQTQTLAGTCRTWARSTPPTQAADLWCQHCAHHGHRHPHDRHRIGGLTVCEWAWTWHQRHGRLPAPAEIDRHAQGKRPGRRVADMRKAVG